MDDYSVIFFLLFVFMAFYLVIKTVYIDVFGHWPTWKEIWDYHNVDEDDD